MFIDHSHARALQRLHLGVVLVDIETGAMIVAIRKTGLDGLELRARELESLQIAADQYAQGVQRLVVVAHRGGAGRGSRGAGFGSAGRDAGLRRNQRRERAEGGGRRRPSTE
jgi:hypothetical protein